MARVVNKTPKVKEGFKTAEELVKSYEAEANKLNSMTPPPADKPTFLPRLTTEVTGIFVEHRVSEFERKDGNTVAIDIVTIRNKEGRNLILKGDLDEQSFKYIGTTIKAGTSVVTTCEIVNRKFIVANEFEASYQWHPVLKIIGIRLVG